MSEASSPDQVLAGLQQVFRRVFDDESIVLRPETTAADIPAWDSLNQVKIIIGIEQAFRIRLKPREINALENVAQMIAHISKALSRVPGR